MTSRKNGCVDEKLPQDLKNLGFFSINCRMPLSMKDRWLMTVFPYTEESGSLQVRSIVVIITG
jgi:hypothetical protein